jgi:hypothetical protein
MMRAKVDEPAPVHLPVTAVEPRHGEGLVVVEDLEP